MSAGWFEPYDSWFGDFNSLRRELDRLFDIGVPLSNIRSVPRGTFPAINMYETKEGVNVQALIPGVDPQKVELNFENNTLTIKGERTTEQAEVPAAARERYHRRERFSGAFTRVVSLPDGINPEAITANCKDGVLNITIAKREEQKPRQIPVKVA
jgi:HSP20 family protein